MGGNTCNTLNIQKTNFLNLVWADKPKTWTKDTKRQEIQWANKYLELAQPH